MSVASSASRLFELLGARDATFVKYLQPGLTSQEMESILAPVSVPIPPDLLEFYRHFNLPKSYAYGPDQPRFYGIYWLLGIEDAVAFWLERRSYDFLEEREHDWFPILQDDGNAYLVDTKTDALGDHNIISVFHGTEPEVVFRSLTAMFETFYEWARQDILPIVDGHLAGDYEGDAKRVRAIASAFNPGIEKWCHS